jgi:tetratricopeptide (TPR) repeat protein
VVEAPITPTCKLVAALLLAGVAVPASAVVSEPDRLATYVAAKAADANGDPGRAAKLFAELVRDLPGEAVIRQRAISEAIEAGDMALALDLSRTIRPEQSPLDLRMLLVAEELRRGRDKQAIEALSSKGSLIDTGFLVPFIEAWSRADRGDPKAVESLDAVAKGSPLATQISEHRALIYLKLKRPSEALAFSQMALSNAGGRADRLRLAFADGFRAAGDRTKALAMLEGAGSTLAAARARLAAGKPLGQSVNSARDAFGELMLGFALALNRLDDKSLTLSLGQIARYSSPDNGATRLLLGLLLDAADRREAALQQIRTVGAGDPFINAAEDAEARILASLGREDEALRRAQASAAARPSADSLSRLGAVLMQMDRHRDAADAYGRALALSSDGTGSDDLWSLYLFRASALEDDGRWAEAKADVEQAMKLSPDNALLLNFLGYGMLERGERLEEAEAMVRKASALRPEDASITDSLGWAQFKMGKVDEAIATLQRAVEGDPEQSEIREHLGDALYTAGRRIEARFAWNAALVNEQEATVRSRIESKLALGLTKANAAP